MTTITLKNSDKILLVPVPEEAKNFTLINSHSYFDSPRIEHSIGGVDLKGKVYDYEILGTASPFDNEVDFEVKREYVMCRPNRLMPPVSYQYLNYESGEMDLRSCELSFLTLLRSSLTPSEDKRFVIIKIK